MEKQKEIGSFNLITICDVWMLPVRKESQKEIEGKRRRDGIGVEIAR